MPSSTSVPVTVQGRELAVTNLDKVLYPGPGFTKAQVIDYYTRIAPVLLPHLADRPLTLKRYPNGVDKPMFYEKNCPSHRPEWFHTIRVWSGHNQRHMDYCAVQDLPSLVWVANLASLELHTSLSTAPTLDNPRTLVFDLDPGPPAGLVECCQVALLLRTALDDRGLAAWPKTSGSKGLQLYVPLNSATATYEATKTISKDLAEQLEQEHPRAVVSRQDKHLRPGKVLIDWSQNDQHKTTVNVYSLRAREVPTVSTPITWAEVDACASTAQTDPLIFDSAAALDRVDRLGDLFADVLTRRQDIAP